MKSLVELAYDRHKDWINIVKSFGANKNYAEDIVQEMYLKINRLVTDKRKIMYGDDDVNRFYIYVTLRNLYSDYKKAKNKYTFFSYLETDDADTIHTAEYLYSDTETEKEEAFYKITMKLAREINSWHTYDAKLCNTYYLGDMSLRQISKGANISLTSIFNSIKNYKAILRNKFIEEFDFYIIQEAEHEKVYKKAKKEGLTERQALERAGYESRNLLDNQKKGVVGASINRYSDFWKARAQGSTVVYEAFRDRPKKAFAMVGITVVVPSIAFYLSNINNEGELYKDYKELPDYIKTNKYYTKLNGKGVYFPKVYEVGTFFASLTEKVLDYV